MYFEGIKTGFMKNLIEKWSKEFTEGETFQYSLVRVTEGKEGGREGEREGRKEKD